MKRQTKLDAKELLKDKENAEEAERAYRRRFVERVDRRAAREYQSRDWKRAKRREILDAFVPDRTCHGCGQVKIDSARWVICFEEERTLVVCRSCYMHGKRLKGRNDF